MGISSVNDFLDRLESDSDFAARLEAVNTDPAAVQEILISEGFDLDPGEVRDAFLERFGSQLTEEQLAEVAGGMGAGAIAAIVVVGGLGSIAAAGAAAAV